MVDDALKTAYWARLKKKFETGDGPSFIPPRQAEVVAALLSQTGTTELDADPFSGAGGVFMALGDFARGNGLSYVEIGGGDTWPEGSLMSPERASSGALPSGPGFMVLWKPALTEGFAEDLANEAEKAGLRVVMLTSGARQGGEPSEAERVFLRDGFGTVRLKGCKRRFFPWTVRPRRDDAAALLNGDVESAEKAVRGMLGAGDGLARVEDGADGADALATVLSDMAGRRLSARVRTGLGRMGAAELEELIRARLAASGKQWGEGRIVFGEKDDPDTDGTILCPAALLGDRRVAAEALSLERSVLVGTRGEVDVMLARWRGPGNAMEAAPWAGRKAYGHAIADPSGDGEALIGPDGALYTLSPAGWSLMAEKEEEWKAAAWRPRMKDRVRRWGVALRGKGGVMKVKADGGAIPRDSDERKTSHALAEALVLWMTADNGGPEERTGMRRKL